MFLIAAAIFMATPSDAPPGARHEYDASIRVERVEQEMLPKSVWRFAADGTATHLQTTLACPTKLGEFVRDKVVVYDGFGLDVGCIYAKQLEARVAIFLTRRDKRSLADDFKSAGDELVRRHPDVRPIELASPKFANLSQFLHAAYVIHGNANLTRVLAADLGGWTLVYRVTNGGAIEETAQAIVELDRIAQSTAGAHLDQCATAKPAERAGVRIDDKALVQRLSLIGGLSAQASDEPAAKHKTQQWCIEAVTGDTQTPMLYWRNIADQILGNDIMGLGHDGPVDRFTLMTMEDPPTWTVEADTGANMLVDKPGSPAPIVHALIRREGYLTSMFAFFRGRPSMATLAPLVRDIAVGRARPVATANAKSGVVTIPKQSP